MNDVNSEVYTATVRIKEGFVNVRCSIIYLSDVEISKLVNKRIEIHAEYSVSFIASGAYFINDLFGHIIPVNITVTPPPVELHVSPGVSQLNQFLSFIFVLKLDDLQERIGVTQDDA